MINWNGMEMGVFEELGYKIFRCDLGTCDSGIVNVWTLGECVRMNNVETLCCR